MDYIGLVWKYKINRVLTEEEREFQLKQKEKQKLVIEPKNGLTIIKMNSTFLETIDKFYTWKGALTSATTSFILLFFVGCLVSLIIMFTHLETNFYKDPVGHILMLFGIFFLGFPAIGFLIWLLLKECFRYTHYPIRFNRKNKMIHVFRLNGTVLSVPWRDVFFTLGKGDKYAGVQNWDIRGHILDKDKKTVLESFPLGFSDDLHENLKSYWEYLRRYMEEGPEQAYENLHYCLPIDEKRESIILGFQLFWVNLYGGIFTQILMIPFDLFYMPGRLFALWTSKIPQWPKEVEEQCQIEAGDPYVKDGRTNPPDRTMWFPK